MSYTIERLTNPSVYLVTLLADFSLSSDTETYHKELDDLLSNEAQPISLILDVREYQITFDNLMGGLRALTQNNLNPYQNSNTCKVIVVTSNRMMKLSVDGILKFGFMKELEVVSSIDEALSKVTYA